MQFLPKSIIFMYKEFNLYKSYDPTYHYFLEFIVCMSKPPYCNLHRLAKGLLKTTYQHHEVNFADLDDLSRSKLGPISVFIRPNLASEPIITRPAAWGRPAGTPFQILARLRLFHSRLSLCA